MLTFEVDKTIKWPPQKGPGRLNKTLKATIKTIKTHQRTTKTHYQLSKPSSKSHGANTKNHYQNHQKPMARNDKKRSPLKWPTTKPRPTSRSEACRAIFSVLFKTCKAATVTDCHRRVVCLLPSTLQNPNNTSKREFLKENPEGVSPSRFSSFYQIEVCSATQLWLDPIAPNIKCISP